MTSGEGTDNNQALVLLPLLKQNLKTIGYETSDIEKATLTGDSGYFRAENL